MMSQTLFLSKWLPDTVTQSKDPLSFLIIATVLDDDRVISHLIDYIGECPPSTIIYSN